MIGHSSCTRDADTELTPAPTATEPRTVRHPPSPRTPDRRLACDVVRRRERPRAAPNAPQSTARHRGLRGIRGPRSHHQVWFTKSTGSLDEHKHVRCDWEMYRVHSDVEVIELAPNHGSSS